ncbi:ArnT family glycosyltransferase [Pontibacter akesuensis]|uniref:Dolichyl-phosphate-mannose-protein mannosyltransferase n=1 Tax=Pontibacter akesuensis TaxID=388950 RepID=A0A1I7GI26_9BACT|nr:glycosyltransferase family 39 protein [Pontibacter akesuensis]GHA56707.1 hypothetical protein GCM10007389_05430 [Pontibacter akesuensis]SFU48068.1 Dolichyl-phosphate-mannose-protein mannosyltransferase [Pontibacter akesuensis]
MKDSPPIQQPTLHHPSNAALLTGERTQVSWSTIAWLFVACGIFLRLFHYIDNRSLWIDEIYLATSLINLDFAALASPPLAYEQKAPIGFLWAVRLAVLAFGESEMALRLFSLLCGIASLFVFLPVARHFLKPFGVAIAIGMLALAPPLVYHSVEVKQYGTSVLASVLCLYLYIRFSAKFNVKDLLLWGGWGALILWFSYEAIFVLAGIAVSVCLTYLVQKRWKALFLSVIPFALWLFSFSINFILFTYKHADSAWLVEWFKLRGAFMPLPPSSLTDVKWFIQAGYLLLEYPLGLLWNSNTIDNQALRILLKMSLLPLIFITIGFVVVFRKNKTTFMLLLFPALLALLASGLELYPFYERLTVFLAPLFILYLASGTQWVAAVLPGKARWRYLFASLILLGPVFSSLQQLYNVNLFGGKKHAHHREAILYIQEHMQPGDVVYVNWNAQPEYAYYREVYDLNFKTIMGKDVRQQSASTAAYFQHLSPDLNEMAKHPRAWVLLNNMMGANIGEVEYPGDLFSTALKDGSLFVKELEKRGELKDAFKGLHNDVYLFDFTHKNIPKPGDAF